MSSFTSMGCEVVVEGASARELERVEALFEERDAAFSRFRAGSELNRVNAAGAASLVSPLFARMVEAAIWARERTGSLVDPTLGAALEAAGYDRDFAELAASEEAASSASAGSVALFGRVLVLGRGAKLDLNGVVKAAAVDDAIGCSRGQASSRPAETWPPAARSTSPCLAAGRYDSSPGASPRAAARNGAGSAGGSSSTT